jgi:hypothetical protein
MVTTGDICISAVAQTRPDRELVAPEMFGSLPWAGFRNAADQNSQGQRIQ